MTKFTWHVVAFLALSLGPSGIATHACEKHNHPIIESKDLPGDSLYQLNSKWVNQQNKPIHLPQLAGKPRIVAMVYTKCQTACPLLVQDIKKVMARLPENLASALHVDLFSFDDNENHRTLQSFRAKYSLPDTWSAYAGTRNDVAELAAALGIQYKKVASGDYIHSNVIFFINEKGEVVAKHEGLGRDSEEFAKKIHASLKNL